MTKNCKKEEMNGKRNNVCVTTIMSDDYKK